MKENSAIGIVRQALFYGDQPGKVFGVRDIIFALLHCIVLLFLV